jgi:hypothetical protein
MFYKFLFCSLFAVLAVAGIGFASIIKDDKKELRAADQFKNLSACCRAEIAQGLVRPETRLEPAEYDDFCTACGHPTDVGLFLVSPIDGTMTDTDTGEAGLVETPGRDLDFGGLDPDEANDIRRDLGIEKLGRTGLGRVIWE